MNKNLAIIYKKLKNEGSVLLVGKNDSGKSWFAINELIPFLNDKGLETDYYKNCIGLKPADIKGDIIIIDEVGNFFR